MKISALFCGALLVAGVCKGYSQSTVQFLVATSKVYEGVGSVRLGVQRTGDLSSIAGVDFATVDVTATNGVRYLSTSGTLSFDPGQTNQTIVVPILDDALAEGAQFFRVILANPSGGAALGAPASATVVVGDNDIGVQFQFASYSVSEDAGTVQLGIVRGDNGTNAVAVDYSTSDLTATSGVDYVGTTNTLSFAPLEWLKVISIPIVNNTGKQPNRDFSVSLTHPMGLSLGSQKSTTVTILDNDQGFALESASYAVAEDAGLAQINVFRGTDATNSAVTVAVTTTDITATSGLDYIGLTNTITFAPGEKLKQIAIPILNDGIKEPNESFQVTLGNPTGGAVLGSPTTATVTILDNDPGVSFESGTYSVWENAGTVSVTVLRGNDVALDPFTVDYATGDQTAVAGRDYEPVAGMLTFARSELVKTINIPILRDESITNDTSFRLLLSNPTGGAVLGTALTIVTNHNAPERGTFRTVAPPFDTALRIQREGGVNFLSWAGGGPLQRADYPDGPWQTLSNAVPPFATQPATPATYYRVASPRPANVYVPSSYDGHTPVPLVVMLHGYSQTGASEEKILRVQPLAEIHGFLYCYPDSMVDKWGQPFWNATDSASDFGNTGVDDAGYLRALIEEIARRFAVDPKRIFLIGDSGGGFMANRMACQSADLIAAAASFAGMTYLDPSRCSPSEPVNVLHIHGTADPIVAYWGGAAVGFPAHMAPYPGAVKLVQIWATYNGATGPVTDAAPSLDLVTDVPGLDTVVTRYTNAPAGGAVELWTINGGVHDPNFSSQFAPKVIEWLLAHPKP
jgi:polyhydroxybutyrate depolymerase